MSEIPLYSHLRDLHKSDSRRATCLVVGLEQIPQVRVQGYLAHKKTHLPRTTIGP